MTRRLVHLVADYGAGDLAFAEFAQRLALALPDMVLQLTPVAPNDTVAAGFCVAELACAPGPPDRLVVHDVGVPVDDDRFCTGRTPDGVFVVGAKTGWSWSFVADMLDHLCHVDVVGAGGRMRARDVLPAAVAHVSHRHSHAIGDIVPLSSIPPVPDGVVVYADRRGNLKTTIAAPPAAIGERVDVHIGPVSAVAVVTDGARAPADGELALAPGSSGWPTREGGHRRFPELSVGAGSAADRFARPPSGAPIALRPAQDQRSAGA
jgi:hypothetical protein